MTLLCSKPCSGFLLTPGKSQSSTMAPHDLSPGFSALLHAPSLCSSHIGLLALCLNLGCSHIRVFLLCSLCLELSSLRYPHGMFLISFGSLSKCHLLQKPFPNHNFEITPPLPFYIFLYVTYHYLIYHIIFYLCICFPLILSPLELPRIVPDTW